MDQKHLIILAEDEALIALDILSMLRPYKKIKVLRVIKGKDLVDKAVELRPELIISDIFLKDDITGVDAVKEIYTTLEVPVLFISGNSMQLAEAKEYFPGSIILPKPFDGSHLLQNLKKLKPLIFNGDLSLVN